MVSSGTGGIILVLLFKTTIFRILKQFMNAGCRRVMNLASLLRRKPHGFQIGDRHLGLLRLTHRLSRHACLNHSLNPRILINEHLALQRLQPRPHLGGGSDHLPGRNGHQGKIRCGSLIFRRGGPPRQRRVQHPAHILGKLQHPRIGGNRLLFRRLQRKNPVLPVHLLPRLHPQLHHHGVIGLLNQILMQAEVLPSGPLCLQILHHRLQRAGIPHIHAILPGRLRAPARPADRRNLPRQLAHAGGGVLRQPCKILLRVGIAEQIRLKRHPGRLRQPADAVHIRGHLHHGKSLLPALPLHQGPQPGPLHLGLIAERHRHPPGVIRGNQLIAQRVQQIGTAVHAQFHPAPGLSLAENPPLHSLLLRQPFLAHVPGNLKQGSLPVPDIILHVMRLRPIQIKPGRLIIHRAINILIRAGVKTVPSADHL